MMGTVHVSSIEHKNETSFGPLARGAIDGGQLAFNVSILHISFLAPVGLVNASMLGSSTCCELMDTSQKLPSIDEIIERAEGITLVRLSLQASKAFQGSSWTYKLCFQQLSAVVSEAQTSFCA